MKLPEGFAYLCDPHKNTECKKTNCRLGGGRCKVTKSAEYRIDGSGRFRFKCKKQDRVAFVLEEVAE